LIRYYRLIEREANSTIWNGNEDIDLCILFGENNEPKEWN